MSALVGGTIGDAIDAVSRHHTSPGQAKTSAGDLAGRSVRAPARDRTSSEARRSAAVLATGGVLLALGGAMHPHETSGTMHDSLLALVGSPAWLPAHAVLLAGMLATLAGLVLLRRTHALPAAVRPWLTGTIIAWAIATPEVVPHLLAGSEHDAFESGGATPMIDTHLALSTVTNPLVGVSAALLAVAVARAARTWPAWVLAALAVVGGVAFAAAAPLLAVTGNPQFSGLFAAQGLVAVWIVGTAVRVARGRRT